MGWGPGRGRGQGLWSCLHRGVVSPEPYREAWLATSSRLGEQPAARDLRGCPGWSRTAASSGWPPTHPSAALRLTRRSGRPRPPAPARPPHASEAAGTDPLWGGGPRPRDSASRLSEGGASPRPARPCWNLRSRRRGVDWPSPPTNFCTEDPPEAPCGAEREALSPPGGRPGATRSGSRAPRGPHALHTRLGDLTGRPRR